MKLLAARRRRLDYRMVFGTDAGKRVLADICRRAGVDQSAFTAGHADVTNFKLGRQDIGQSILKKMEMSDEEIREVTKSQGDPYAS